MTRPGIEPRSPGALANTQTARPMSGDLIMIKKKKKKKKKKKTEFAKLSTLQSRLTIE